MTSQETRRPAGWRRTAAGILLATTAVTSACSAHGSSTPSPTPEASVSSIDQSAQTKWQAKEQAYKAEYNRLQKLQRKVALAVIDYAADKKDSHIIDFVRQPYEVPKGIIYKRDLYSNILMPAYRIHRDANGVPIPGATISMNNFKNVNPNLPEEDIPYDGLYMRIGSMVNAADYNDPEDLQIWQKARLGASSVARTEEIWSKGGRLTLADYRSFVDAPDTTFETTLTTPDGNDNEIYSTDLGKLETPTSIQDFSSNFSAKLESTFANIDMARFK